MSAFLQVAGLPPSLRSQYLASLPEPQEWFLEDLVRSGDVWEAPGAAYAVFHGAKLVEFYAQDAAAAHIHLSALARLRPFKEVLCKSFDHAVMDAGTKLGWDLAETGFLFRKRNPVSLDRPAAFQLKRARSADLADVWRTGPDFYDSEEEVGQLFRSDGLWVAINDGQLVGSGVMIPIDATGEVVDVGMVTRPNQRNRGYASLIVSELAHMLERQGKRPICGCGDSNLASKAALQNAGFVSEHRLVRISLP